MSQRLVRVIPDVGGLDSSFDYEFPQRFGEPRIGMRVRIPLHGRNVGGWIERLDTTPPPGKTLREVRKVSGWGPSAEMLELAAWAAHRWATKRNVFLQTASPPRNVYELPKSPARDKLTTGAGAISPDALDRDAFNRDAINPNAFDSAPCRLRNIRWPPALDPYPLVLDAISNGPALILVPSQRAATRLITRLRNDGHRVGAHPEDWALGRSGGVSIVGTMSAAWAPVEPLRRVLVLDSHDRGFRQEGAPTWDALAVAHQRARHSGANVDLVSPTPRLEHLELGELITPNPEDERRGWANIQVVDMRQEDPRNGLFSHDVATAARNCGRVVCVLNRKGRSTLLSCMKCQRLASCSRCEGRLVITRKDSNQLDCKRCDFSQPVLCVECGGTKFKQLRVGVNQAAEQLQTLINKAVGEVTQQTDSLPQTEVLVGTEAVLHRIGAADVVAFLDFDQELMAQRIRADEDALVLLARASKLVRGKKGRVIIQSRQGDHPVIAAGLSAQPGQLAASLAPIRKALRWPPYAAVATVGGPNAAAFVASAPPQLQILGPSEGTYMLKATSLDALADALASMQRPAGKLGLRVDPYDI